MKRRAELRELSRQHHGALKMARASRRIADGGHAAEIERQARQALSVFAAELEPHFQAEEQGLLRLLAAAGQTELVERTLAEHAALRGLVAELQRPDAATLRRFAELMEAHVRFEERELFEQAQKFMAAPGD